MQDLGIVRPGSPVRILWGSYDGGDGSSITATAYAVGDIKIFKDGGTTERASTSGYVVDDDFSAETGIHLAEFDLADNSTAGFFVAGSEYLVMVGPVTIDAQTVNFPLCRFTIGYPGAILDTGITSLTSATQFILDNGPAEADVLIGCPVILHDVASRVQFAFGVVSDYIVTTKEVFLAVTPVGFTPVATDNVSFFMPTSVHSLIDTMPATPQGAPPTTPTIIEAAMVLYDALVHKIDIDSGFKEFSNNAGTVIWKKALSDDASNYIEAESETGP